LRLHGEVLGKFKLHNYILFPMKVSSKINKILKIFGTALIQITLFAAISSLIYNENFLIVAQIHDTVTNVTNSSQSIQPDESIGNQLTSGNNFNAEGIITSVTADPVGQKDGMVSNQNVSSVSNSAITSQVNILGGKWKIDVVNGHVEYFNSNMTMITSNGTDMHDHLIEFKSDDPDILLLPNNTAVINPNSASGEIAALDSSLSDKNITSVSRTDGNVVKFSGVADILTNGVIEWRDVPTSASIFNDNVISIEIDPKIVKNHFSGTPIYGLVNTIEPIKVVQNGSRPSIS
jgi:hypothetical protein